MANLKQIERHLRDLKLPFRVVNLDQKAFTVADVVNAGISLDQVVKTLIVRVADGSFIALALRGSDRVDFKKIRTKFGGKSELAKPEEVLRVVGVAVGAVCPILVGLPLYIDNNVMNLQNVHMGSGDLKHGLEMAQKKFILSVGKYTIWDFVQF